MEEKLKISEIKEFEINYVKSPDYKNIFATGVYGGATLNGLINMNFFIDTLRIPEKVTLEIKDGKFLSEKPRKLIEVGTTRELAIGVSVDLNTAKIIKDWLGDKISLLEIELEKTKKLQK